MTTTLAQATQELEDLQSDRKTIEAALAESVVAFDADGMIRYRNAIKTNEIKQVAHQAKLLGLQRDDQEQNRLAAIAERDRLFEEVKVANAIWNQKIDEQNEARIVAQTIQLKIMIQDQVIQGYRESRNDHSQKQKQIVASFIEENTIKPANEIACDLN